MLGFSNHDEVVGKPVMDFIAPESKQMVTERIARLENGKDNPTAEFALIMQDGIKITVEAASVSVPVEGTSTAVIIAHDNKERRMNEENQRVKSCR